MRPWIFAALLVLLLSIFVFGSPVAADEFLGPFASWANVKTDYGAVGDGKADDTAAIQRALEDIRKPEFPKRVLYFPAGTYRLTDTVKLLRETHNQSQGVCIFGEDPERTVLRWDGPEGGVMLHYNPWYASLGRLTFDGAGKAKTAIQHGVAFTTYNEITDLIVRDVEFGIEAGMRDGIAETAVLRCRFYRCSQAAISIQNFNSLDWYIWHCWFEDCRIAVTNEFGAGNFHVYESTFLRSREADVTIKHCGYFSLLGNLSLESKAFFVAKRADNWTDAETWGANFTLQRNTVIDPQDATPIRIANNGPILLLDNLIRSREQSQTRPVVLHACPSGEADLVAVGNTFTVENPLEVKGRLRVVDDKIAPRAEVKAPQPAPCPFLPRRERPTIEVPAGADEAALQEAINEAAKLSGRRPVVHLPAGTYNVRQTLVIPANSDLQLVGDGVIQATQLNWGGPGEGPILLIEGPSRATLRYLGFSGGRNARAIVATGCDQPGGRVFMEQGNTSGYEYGLVIDGLDQTYVALHDHGHNGLKVSGGPEATQGRRPAGMTALFCGASSRDRNSQDEGVDLYALEQGARLLVRDIWYEGQIWHFMNFTGAGEFTYHSGNIAPYSPPTADDAVIALDGFQGKVTLSQIEPMNGPLRVRQAPNLRLLMLGLITRDAPLQLDEAGGAQIAFLSGREMRKEPTGTDSLPDIGEFDPAFVREMLATLRNELPRPLTEIPAGATDLRFYRVMAYGKEGISLQGAP